MSSSLLTIIAAVTLGQFPATPYDAPYGAPGMAANGSVPAGVYAAPDSTHAFNTGDPLYPFDALEPWVHGHWQEIPAYGGFHSFRPYNYKHVLSQSQVAGGWGMSPNMAYSQDFFRRIREQMMHQEQAQLRSSLYETELAKLRARHDFERMKQGYAESFREIDRTYPTQVVGGEEYAGQRDFVESADYSRQNRLQMLQRKIEAQSFELQRLRQEYEGESVPRR